MAGKWDLRVNDIIEDINGNTHTIFHSIGGKICCSDDEYSYYPMPESNIAKLVSRAPLDLSAMSREQLEDLGQRAAVELEKKGEVEVVYGSMSGVGWFFTSDKAETSIAKLTIPKRLPYSTYTSPDGDVIKVEEV